MNAIAALAGMLLSLSFRYIPGLRTWFERLSSEGKSGVMAIMIIVAGICTALWQCSSSPLGEGWIEVEPRKFVWSEGTTTWDCLSLGWKEYARAVFSALVTNQATHQITPSEKKDI
jgi:hypothetical protein